jgi:Glycosyltransferase family 92
LSVDRQAANRIDEVKAYLSVCAIYRDEARYLREWLEFHRLVGVERFFLYDNASADDHRELLAPYVDDGIVSAEDWPRSPGQFYAYQDCLNRHRDESRWIAFIDSDEFLFSPTGRPVSELLAEYERWAGVCVNWVVFGTSGHETPPEGLVIENYVQRTALKPRNSFVKSIVDPARAAWSLSPHHFHYREGFAVDENKNPASSNLTAEPSVERLRINHYYTRSREEWLVKREEPNPYSGRVRIEYDPRAPGEYEFNDERDETVQIYLPALRRALEMSEAARLGH